MLKPDTRVADLGHGRTINCQVFNRDPQNVPKEWTVTIMDPHETHESENGGVTYVPAQTIRLYGDAVDALALTLMQLPGVGDRVLQKLKETQP